MTTLNLSNRNLTSIPDSIFSLRQLTSLNLGNNFILYPPLSALGHDDTTNMNKIMSIPKEIKYLQKLKTLGLCYNNLMSLPDELANLRLLDTLDISFNIHLNNATALATLKRMTWLKYLDIMATSIDQKGIKDLHNSLPVTKIYAEFKDIPIKTSE